MTDSYIGQRFGNYQVLRLLGKGNFAGVYLAEHRFLEVPKAIKLLHVHMNTIMYEQFLHEARTVAHLQHPHIVCVYDFGIENQIPYLVMDHMPYGTVRTLYPKGTRVPLEQIVAYVKQIAPALDYAHQQRVIHRDIKPENILLNDRKEAVISDFGIAIVQQALNPPVTVDPAGTPIYMAPELIERRPCPASDQYSLGVLVYEWIAGEPPFRGSSIFEIWSQHIHQAPPSLRDHISQLPTAVEDAVFGTLAKNPKERFATVQDFAMVLEEACFATQFLSVHSAASISVPSPAVSPPQGAREPQLITPLYARDRVEAVAELTPQATTQNRGGMKGSRSTTVRMNRLRLLRRVRSFWIEGVLHHSLHGAALIALGLQERSDVVANPWTLALQSPDAVARLLPVDTQIMQVYDTANGELLILGAPGSGKTTLLLALARDLLERAEHDETHPVPVIFNLSSWALKQQPLADWLIEELLSKYQVPRKLGRKLVNAEQILPLLDGLDEVAPKGRTACIEAINSYRQQHGLLSMVVCSRRADYLALTTRVLLDCAVVVQPLTEQQIDNYLKRGGAALQTLRLALHQNSELRALASTPLMLSILTLTYHDLPIEQLLHSTSPSELQRQVFERYVQRMLSSRNSGKRYMPGQTTYWLSWLARQLVRRNQTMFSIERMQPDWLDGRWALRRYPGVVAGLIFGLLGVLCLGPLSGFLVEQAIMVPTVSIVLAGVSILWGLLVGCLFGLINGLVHGQERNTHVRKKWSWRRIWWRSVRGLLNGGFVGLFIGLPYVLSIIGHQPVGVERVIVFVATLLIGLLSGSIFLLIDGFLHIQVVEIRPMETFVWSWVQMARNFVKFLCLGLLGLLLIGLLFGLIYGLYEEYKMNWTGNGLLVLSDMWIGGRGLLRLFGASFALICGLIGALTGGLAGDILDERNLTTPNQGIRRSARHSVLIACIGIVVGGIAGGWFGYETMPAHNLEVFFIFALIFGPLIGVVSGLRTGGVACIQHLVLRWLLWETGSLPWNYARFLDYAAEHVLLRKVGGGYMFVHRMLLEYFASLDG